jgi:hypothetical protein
MERSAFISADGKYRYLLSRDWGEVPGMPRVLWVMLNGSTADGVKDDPTVRRCIGFSKRWGYGSLDICNLFGFRTLDPKVLMAAADPVGEFNDECVMRAAIRAQLIVVAWGNHGSFMARPEVMGELLGKIGVPMVHLGLTKSGEPRHPLYVRGDMKPKGWLPPFRTW